MTSNRQLVLDLTAAADHLDSFDCALNYDEFVAELLVAVPDQSSDVHWMADNQLVNIFFAQRQAATAELTGRMRQWIADFSRWTIDGLRADGFKGFVRFADLPATDVPKAGGVYLVVRSRADVPPEFQEISPAGWFQRRDPSVPLEKLQSKWVRGAEVIYIGVATPGTNGRRGIAKRLDEFRRHGAGEPIGHWGGRYIWCLADSDELLVAWRVEAEDPGAVEAELTREFTAHYGRLPFANLKQERRRTQP